MPARPRHRLYVPCPLETGATVTLDEEGSHYVARVLRLKSGDTVAVFNGRGGEYDASVNDVSKRAVVLCIGRFHPRDVESPLRIHLVQGISRGERMDLVVQKATELGVQRITPVLTEFSVVRLDVAKSEKRALHWLKVARSACEQCGRNAVPVIDPPRPLGSWLEAPEGAARFMLHPGAKQSLASAAATYAAVELLVGPEGGLSDGEYGQALAAGYVSCSLGPRILRTETAAIAAIAVLQAACGDLG